MGKYVDALYVSVRGRMQDGYVEVLGGMKETLRDSGGRGQEHLPVPGLPGGPLQLQLWGRGKYQFVLRNRAVRVEVTMHANLPALMIQFESHVLYEHDLEGLEYIVDTLAGYFLQPGFEVLVNRFDLALDFQGEGWVPPDLDDVVTRAREPNVWYRQVDGLNRPECMTFGKVNSALQIQIYLKTEELKKSHKTWMYDVWRGSRKYSEALAVWRVEYRFRRKKLHRLGINTITDLRVGLGNLVRSVVGDERVKPWIRMASPETRGRRQDHRPAAPWWEEIRAATLDGTLATATLRERHDRGPVLEHTKGMLFAYAERFMALGGGEGLHPEATTVEEFFALMGEQYYEHLDSKGMSRSEALNARRDKMGIVPMPLDLVTTAMVGR